MKTEKEIVIDRTETYPNCPSEFRNITHPHSPLASPPFFFCLYCAHIASSPLSFPILLSSRGWSISRSIGLFAAAGHPTRNHPSHVCLSDQHALSPGERRRESRRKRESLSLCLARPIGQPAQCKAGLAAAHA